MLAQELQRIIELADIREKVIVSILALSGMRIGTLVKLKYRHVMRAQGESLALMISLSTPQYGERARSQIGLGEVSLGGYYAVCDWCACFYFP